VLIAEVEVLVEIDVVDEEDKVVFAVSFLTHAAAATILSPVTVPAGGGDVDGAPEVSFFGNVGSSTSVGGCTSTSSIDC
jgi:hypothetical protein